ncbi:MAG: TIGR01777 family oxidoreductase [Myxococcota bacterium]
MTTVAITGASGLIGSALRRSLEADGHRVRAMVRRAPQGDEIGWSPAEGTLDAAALEGVDAVVHLAGESVASGRWSEARKERIRSSRVQGTDLLARALAGCTNPPRVLVSASAIGFYGSRGDETLVESAGPGEGFLAEVCAAWESAADPARDAGLRVVHPRIGIVLAKDGGALSKMLTPFRMGVGGVVGSGTQFMSWIHLDDVVGMLRFVIEHEVDGPFNAVGPAPVTNAEFTRALGRALKRPTFLPLPRFAARMALGEMADGLLLASARVLPEKIAAEGFRFRFETLANALDDVLGG